MPWSKLLILKNLISEVNGSNVDPGHCNSNAGDLFSPQGRYRLVRICHGRTNFAGQPSMRMSNF
jgi:hypothetical protein